MATKTQDLIEATTGLVSSLPDGLIDWARDGIGHTNANVIIHWRDKASAALKALDKAQEPEVEKLIQSVAADLARLGDLEADYDGMGAINRHTLDLEVDASGRFKMTPMHYYTTLRSQWHYRPPVALLATLAWFCDSDNYWQRAQKLSDWMASRLPEDRQSNAVERHNILADEQERLVGSLEIGEEDLCSDCMHLDYRLPTSEPSDCSQIGADRTWPCKLNADGYTIACPKFLPIGSSGDNYV